MQATTVQHSYGALTSKPRVYGFQRTFRFPGRATLAVRASTAAERSAKVVAAVVGGLAVASLSAHLMVVPIVDLQLSPAVPQQIALVAAASYDDEVRAVERAIPRLEEDVKKAPIAQQKSAENELQSIEYQMRDVEEQQARGATDSVVKQEVGGILNEIESFKSSLGL